MKIDPKLLTGGTARVLTTTGVNAASLAASSRTASPAPFAGGTDSLSEEAFHALVTAAAAGLGWEVAHCRKVLCKRGERAWWETTMPEGWPDLFLVRGPTSLFAELKTDRGRQKPAQKRWQKLLEAAGHTYLVWRPRDWPEVVRLLTEG